MELWQRLALSRFEGERGDDEAECNLHIGARDSIVVTKHTQNDSLPFGRWSSESLCLLSDWCSTLSFFYNVLPARSRARRKGRRSLSACLRFIGPAFSHGTSYSGLCGGGGGNV